MQRPQTESQLSKRPSSKGGEGGLAASIKAASKSSEPIGKGIAMAVLAVLVVAAVAFELVRGNGDEAPKGATPPESTPPLAKQDEAPQKAPPRAPSLIDARFDLPPELSLETGRDLAMALTRAASPHEAFRSDGLAAIPKLYRKVPAELRDATRARLLAHLGAIGDDKAARGPVLSAASPLVLGLPADQLQTARRLMLLARLALFDDSAASHGLIFLSNLPEEARPVDEIEAVVLDAKRSTSVRVAAALALPKGERSADIQALAADEDAPTMLRRALQ